MSSLALLVGMWTVGMRLDGAWGIVLRNAALANTWVASLKCRTCQIGRVGTMETCPIFTKSRSCTSRGRERIHGIGWENLLTPGEITNQIRVKIKNRSGQDAHYAIRLADGAQGKLSTAENPIAVATDETRTVSVLITLPRAAFQNGRYERRCEFPTAGSLKRN